MRFNISFKSRIAIICQCNSGYVAKNDSLIAHLDLHIFMIEFIKFEISVMISRQILEKIMEVIENNVKS